MSFGSRLRKARRAKYTQDELANKLNVSRQLISKWETDKSEPSIRFLAELAVALDVSRDYLIDGVFEDADDTTT